MRSAVCLSAQIFTMVSLFGTVACRDSEPTIGVVGRPSDVGPVVAAPARFNFGTAADSAAIAAWNIDANAAGEGLPPGSGTYNEGARLYSQQCAACHGQDGEGGGAGAVLYPKLISREPTPDFAFGRDPKIAKTIGNYWPYATTLYDYIHRTMPLTAPGSLTPSETYSIVAYLLAENGVVPRTTVVDAASLPEIKMPARDKFVADDRKGGPAFR